MSEFNTADLQRPRRHTSPPRELSRAVRDTYQPPTEQQSSQQEAPRSRELKIGDIFKNIPGEFRPGPYTVDARQIPEQIQDPGRYIFHEQQPFFVFDPPGNPNGWDWHANPDVVPFAYEQPLPTGSDLPTENQNPRFINGEAATQGDSGLVALCAEATENPHDQARLFTRVASAVLDIHSHNRHPQADLFGTWYNAQLTPQERDGEMIAPIDLFVAHDLQRPAQERLFTYSTDTPPTIDINQTIHHKDLRVQELQEAMRRGRVTPSMLRAIEALSHSIDIGQMVQDMAATPLPDETSQPRSRTGIAESYIGFGPLPPTIPTERTTPTTDEETPSTPALTRDHVREMLAEPDRPPRDPNDQRYPGEAVTRAEAQEMLAQPIRPLQVPTDPQYPTAEETEEMLSQESGQPTEQRTSRREKHTHRGRRGGEEPQRRTAQAVPDLDEENQEQDVPSPRPDAVPPTDRPEPTGERSLAERLFGWAGWGRRRRQRPESSHPTPHDEPAVVLDDPRANDATQPLKVEPAPSSRDTTAATDPDKFGPRSFP